MSAQEEALAADRQMGKAVCKVCDAVCVPVEDCLYKAPAGETCCGAPARTALLALGGVLGLLQLLDLLQFDVSLGDTPAMLSYDPYELWTDVLTAAFFVGGSYSVYAEDKDLASPMVVSPPGRNVFRSRPPLVTYLATVCAAPRASDDGAAHPELAVADGCWGPLL